MISLLCLLLAPAAAHVWDGTFSGDHLHKSLQVCVDCDTTTCYGQGLADERAYLRGIITKDQGFYTWKGTYYEPGKGSLTGNFALKLNSVDSTYTGSFSTVHTSDLLSDTKAKGKSISKQIPSDAECFRADLDYVTDDSKGFVNGFVEPTDDYPSDFKSFTGETYTGSYTVVLDGDTILGVQNGNCYLGKTQKDVCTATWYETGPAEGISLIVAKNATHHFETWYYIPSLSLFDKEHIEDETECFHNEHSTFIMVQDISEPKISLQRSTEHACSALWTEALEKMCFNKCEDLPSCTKPGARRLESGCVGKLNGGQCISKPTKPKTTNAPTKPAATTQIKVAASGSKREGLMLALMIAVITLV